MYPFSVYQVGILHWSFRVLHDKWWKKYRILGNQFFMMKNFTRLILISSTNKMRDVTCPLGNSFQSVSWVQKITSLGFTAWDGSYAVCGTSKDSCCIYHLDLEECEGVGFLSPGGYCTTRLLCRLSYLEDALLAEFIISNSVGGRATSSLFLPWLGMI